jgi:hypothetical protein
MGYPSDEQKSVILNLLAEAKDVNSPNFGKFYLVYQAVLDQVTTQDEQGREIPVASIDTAAWLWLRGCKISV